MYKCVDAKGKIAYSNLPCPGQAKAAKQFEVAAPESAEDSAARLGAEQARLRNEEAAFKVRHARRSAALDDQLRQGEFARRRQEQANFKAVRAQAAQQSGTPAQQSGTPARQSGTPARQSGTPARRASATPSNAGKVRPGAGQW